MDTAFDIKILWIVVKDVFDLLSKQKEKNKDEIINAHNSINSAFIYTYDYLRNNNGQYKPNAELAVLWNIASTAVLRIDITLGEMLYNKSRFWLDPELYINLNRQFKIIELEQVVDEMERLRIKLR